MSPVFGLLILDKPVGPTSHDVVARVRRMTRERRVGHAGTLDPMASGVLILALGEATRLLEYIVGVKKGYDATLTLGIQTDTYDMEGEITQRVELPTSLTCNNIEDALSHFRGEIQQVPPVYSAVKIDGKSAHARVRAGEDIELQPRDVTIYELNLTNCQLPEVSLTTSVSSGTYIRSLAHDIGIHLGVGATLSALRRTSVGRFTLSQTITLSEFEEAVNADSWEACLQSPHNAFDTDIVLQLDETMLEDISHGRMLNASDVSDIIVPALAPDGTMVAVLEGQPEKGVWRPKKVFRKQLESTIG